MPQHEASSKTSRADSGATQSASLLFTTCLFMISVLFVRSIQLVAVHVVPKEVQLTFVPGFSGQQHVSLPNDVLGRIFSCLTSEHRARAACVCVAIGARPLYWTPLSSQWMRILFQAIPRRAQNLPLGSRKMGMACRLCA